MADDAEILHWGSAASVSREDNKEDFVVCTELHIGEVEHGSTLMYFKAQTRAWMPCKTVIEEINSTTLDMVVNKVLNPAILPTVSNSEMNSTDAILRALRTIVSLPYLSESIGSNPCEEFHEHK
jgi:hypothetical protein